MSLPPWHGVEEPDFMPDIRRQFAEYLPVRMQRARSSLDVLALRVTDHSEPAESLFTVAHDLSGTASSLGGEALGEAARRLAGATRSWSKSESPPDPVEVAAAESMLAELEALSSEFLAWMEVDGEA